jgi:hypothetical protein
MLNLYRKSLEEAGCFTGEYPKEIENVMGVIPGNIPDKMKALMAASELTLFTSHLRKPIKWHTSTIPVNMIAFLVAASGKGKNISIKHVRNLLLPGYSLIDIQREHQARIAAAEAAVADNKQASDWKKYYSKPRALIANVSTLPGLMKHLATLEAGTLGAGFLYVDEIGSELVSNKDLSDNIVALAVGYDSGEIPPKLLKDDAQQVEPIKNLPFSGLMFGSPANIIYDDTVKKKFKDEFNTKLSRRSHFCFSKEAIPKPVYSSIQESRQAARDEVKRITALTETLTPWFTSLVEITTHEPLIPSKEVEDLFSDYEGYNSWLADTITKQHPMSILHRQHMQWKSLKLAGALAILNNSETIEKEHYVAAINFTEIFADDLTQFEIELGKEPYELFVDYMQSIAEYGYANISIHKLRKLGFVKGNGSPQNKMLELIELAKSYDSINKYEFAEGYIHFYAREDIPEEHHEEY